MPVTYKEAMGNLNRAVYAAVQAARREDGAPVAELQELGAEIDNLIEHGARRSKVQDPEIERILDGVFYRVFRRINDADTSRT
tara:strand:+ start:120 stop:368 length:249 start_codon:yes stop_codon:yes gene_type:complete